MEIFSARAVAVCPEGAILYHRMGIVAAEAINSVNRRTDRRMQAASRMADEIANFATDARALMECASDPSVVTGPGAAIRAKMLKRVMVGLDAFKKTYEWFDKEHGALLQPGTKEIVLRFLTWLPPYYSSMRESALTFERKIKADLRADRDRLGDLASSWSIVDADIQS